MNYLTQGFKKTFHSIKEHKTLFAFLVFLEIIFIISSATLIVVYQMKILSNVKNIIEPIESANYNETALQQGQPFTQNMLQIYDSYNQLIKDIFYLFSWFYLLFFFLNGIIWIYTHQLLESKSTTTLTFKENFKEKINQIGQLFSKYGVIYLILTLPLILILYFTLKSTLNFSILPETFSTIAIIIGIIFIIFIYFLLVFFAFLNIPSWKEFIKTTLKISFKKIHYTLNIILINSLLSILCLYLIYLTTPLENLYILSISLVLIFTIIIVLARIFWIATLQELKSKQ